jgi:hypothetical protein
MTIQLRNVINNRLTSLLRPPENFLILFLMTDSLLKCTVSTTQLHLSFIIEYT